MPQLFQPLTIRGLTLPNRIVVAPMCQYSAANGLAGDWHLQHYGSLVASGPGMVVIEATAVSPEGRISPQDLGLYSDATEAAFTNLVRRIKAFGSSKIAVQIAHAGRKASSYSPWRGRDAVPVSEGGWQPVAPSPVPFGPGWPTPSELGSYEMDHLRQSFVHAAKRAERAGIDAVEVHVAHGYLLHEFLSPLTNKREDVYGGSLVNRMRFPLEVLRAVRGALHSNVPLGMRISATDWVEGGFDVDEAVVFAAKAKNEGVDYICVSSGGIVPDAKIPLGAGYQVPLAARIHDDIGLPTRAVGMIADPIEAEAILDRQQADMIALGRAFLDDPRWVWRAAEALGAEPAYPPQYLRATPKLWPGGILKKTAPCSA